MNIWIQFIEKLWIIHVTHMTPTSCCKYPLAILSLHCVALQNLHLCRCTQMRCLTYECDKGKGEFKNWLAFKIGNFVASLLYSPITDWEGKWGGGLYTVKKGNILLLIPWPSSWYPLSVHIYLYSLSLALCYEA